MGSIKTTHGHDEDDAPLDESARIAGLGCVPNRRGAGQGVAGSGGGGGEDGKAVAFAIQALTKLVYHWQFPPWPSAQPYVPAAAMAPQYWQAALVHVP